MKSIAVYDKATWHGGHSTFPRDLGADSSGVYGGFFFAWCVLSGLIDAEYGNEAAQDIRAFLGGEITPAKCYMQLGGVLASDMLNEEGNRFARHCFESEEFDFYGLFEQVLAEGLPSPYHVHDSRQNLDKLGLKLDEEINRWRESL